MDKDKIVYICQGTCGARVSEEEYDKGLKKCGAETCTYYGTPFVKMNIDNQGHMYPAVEKHKH